MDVILSIPDLKELLVAKRVAGGLVEPQPRGLMVGCREAVVFSPHVQVERIQAAPAAACLWTEKQSLS